MEILQEIKKPYSFSYGVQDDYAGNKFGQTEESDGKSVTGSYTLVLPDGRKQTVRINYFYNYSIRKFIVKITNY